MTIASKNDICNLTLDILGNADTVTNIDIPSNQKEVVFKLWYDITRQNTLKQMMPNFALDRRIVALTNYVPAFGYAYAYEYPADCLKLLGIGGVSEKTNDYAVEGGYILTNESYPDGMPIRIIKDVESVVLMSAEFKTQFAWELADVVCASITQNAQKSAMIKQQLPIVRISNSGVNAQENRPIRISNSRARAARISDVADRSYKP